MLYAFIYDTTTFLWPLCLNLTHISTRAGTYKLVDICHNQTDLILENMSTQKLSSLYNRIVIRFPISHEINHPAIGVSQLQGERSTAADMCRYMDQRLQAGLQLILVFWGYLEVGHGSSMAGFDCMVPTYPVEVQIQWFDSWMTIRFGGLISCRNMQKAFFRKMLFSWRKNMPPPAWGL